MNSLIIDPYNIFRVFPVKTVFLRNILEVPYTLNYAERCGLGENEASRPDRTENEASAERQLLR